jgi:hypothetical protein
LASTDLEKIVEQAQLAIASRCEVTRKRHEREEACARSEGISLEELHDRDASRSLRELLFLAGRIDF